MLTAWILFSLPLFVLGTATIGCLGGNDREMDAGDAWGGIVFFLCPFWAIYFLIR